MPRLVSFERPLGPQRGLRAPLTGTPPGMEFTQAPLITVDRPRLIDVVHWMRRLAHHGKSDPRIRRVAEMATAEVDPTDYAGQAYAIYTWVIKNIRYLRDPHDVEYLQMPRNLLESRCGDCDDTSLLIAALLMSIGQHCAFCVAAYDGNPEPSHVFAMVRCPDGSYRPLDTVANKETARAYRRMTWSQIIPV